MKWATALPPDIHPKKLSHPSFVGLSLSHGSHNSLEALVRGLQVETIQPQEHVRGHRARAFVAVDKRMILHDMKEIGCYHLEQVGVQELAGEPDLWHRNRRFQQAKISNADSTTIPPDLVAMDLEAFGKGEKDR